LLFAQLPQTERALDAIIATIKSLQRADAARIIELFFQEACRYWRENELQAYNDTSESEASFGLIFFRYRALTFEDALAHVLMRRAGMEDDCIVFRAEARSIWPELEARHNKTLIEGYDEEQLRRQALAEDENLSGRHLLHLLQRTS
jgi:hypothetical protein